MTKTWLELADDHLKRDDPLKRIETRRVFRRVPDGAELQSRRSWLHSLATTTSFCPSFVADAVGWPVFETEFVVKRRTVVKLAVFSKKGGLEKSALVSRFTDVLHDFVGMFSTRVIDSTPPSSVVHVDFVMHGARRKLPDVPGDPLMPVHINGGVTTFSTPTRILVYRKEDACKVLIHELLHFYRVDRTLFDGDFGEPAQAIMREFGIRPLSNGIGRFGLAECYVDTIACFLHAKWASRPIGPLVRHMNIVAARLLLHMGVPGADLKGLKARGGMSEGTHVFSYYVCKAAIANRAAAFFKTHTPDSTARLDAARFASFVCSALRAWAPSPAEVNAASQGTAMRMTCIS